METFHEQMMEYKKEMEIGVIQSAYRGLMGFIMGLKMHFKNTYPEYTVSGRIYQGYMDMTYFSIIPEALKERKLKIAVVFLHQEFRFETWLSGQNKQVLTRYWELIEQAGWGKYRIVKPDKGSDSILEHSLVEDPDFRNLDDLTQRIETETTTFLQDVVNFISDHERKVTDPF